MPQEIADSDDEIDLASTTYSRNSNTKTSGELPSTASNNVPEHLAPTSSQLLQDPLIKIDFDHFLSPTQRLSSYDGNFDGEDLHYVSARIDSSNDRFLNRLGPASLPINSSSSAVVVEVTGMAAGGNHTRKRSRGQVDEGAKSSSSATSAAESRKKAKTTYGRNNGVANMSTHLSHEHPEFQGLINNEIETEIGETYETMNPALLEPTDQFVSVEERTQYTSPLQVSLSYENENTRRAQHSHIRTSEPYISNASLFGTNMQGLTASRSSIGNFQSFNIDPNCNPFGSASQIAQHGDFDTTHHTTVTRDQHTTHDEMVEMQTSSVRDEIKPPEKLSIEVEEEPQPSPPFSPITNPDDQGLNVDKARKEGREDEIVVPSEQALSTDTIKPPPKKRGRKPKQQQIEPDYDEVDELHMDDVPATRSIRATTVDSVSNMSENSQATSTGKKGRKKKSKKREDQKLDALPKKMPSSELGLDNENVIGLPPEMYNPRPSKRRAQSELDPQPEAVPEEVDDRDEEHKVIEASIEPLATEAPQKGKRGRKAKNKKSKTETVVDVVEVVENYDQKAETNTPYNAEANAALKDETNPVDDDDDINVVTRAHISVDVPVLPRSEENEETLPAKPEPKKRGRKRKKPIKEIDEPVAEEAQQEPDAEDDHPVLVEKDTNTNFSATKAPMTDDDNENDKENREDEKPGKEVEATDTTQKSSTTSSRTLLNTAKPTPLLNSRARIGLSKRHSIPSLLRKVDRNKEAPKTIEKKEKVTKAVLEAREQERIAREEAEAEGREYVPLDTMRGKDGLLIEWDF